MKEGWEYKKLGEVCKIYQPQTIASNLLKEDGKYPVFGANGMIGRYDSYNHEDPEVLLCCRGATCGAINISLPFSWINGNAMVVRPINDSYLKTFLRYLLLTLDYSHIITGAAQPQITRKSIEPVIVPVPPISEQQSIVDYLDSAFAKIDTMKANAEKALNEAKALFQASLKEMLEPKEGWEEKILQDICSDIVDCPHTTPKKVGIPTQYPCIRTSELKGGSIDWSTMQYLDEDEYKKRVSRLVPKANDLVYGREGTYGDAVLLPEGYSFSLGQRTMLLRPNEIYIIPKFLLYSMISPHVYQQAKAKNSGCGVGHVNVKDIKVFRIGLPTIEIQQSIVATLDSLKSKVDRLQANYDKISQECDALKQAILRQVFE